jgi:hypothetical protein
MASAAIISLAILKVNWDEQRRDYLQTFVPIIAECIRLSGSEVVATSELRDALLRRFGLSLPHNVVERLLRRLKRAGYLIVDEARMYRPEREKLGQLGFHEVQQRVLADHQALIESLMAFQSQRYAVGWTAEEAEAAPQSYLDTYQLGLISATTRGQPVPRVRESRKGSRFIVGAFVQHLQDSGAADLAYLETVAQGNMLAQAVFVLDPERPERGFRNTKVFLDTTFLLNALGYNGPAQEAPCLELLELLYRAGADLRCFKHTLGEMRGVLYFSAVTMARGEMGTQYSSSTEYFLQTGHTASDVELYAVRLDKDLARLRVTVVDKPAYGPPERYRHVIDEVALAQLLDREVRYPREGPLARDVDSISAVMRLREGERSALCEESRALFVTTNTSLAEACQRFFYDEDAPYAVPPCVTDRDLTTILWVKMPLGASGLPRKRMIADCYAAMQPEPRLWHRYVDEIERLEKTGTFDHEDVLLLRHSLEARHALMELTTGEEDALARGAVPEILERARAKIRGGLESRVESAVRDKSAAEAETAALRKRDQDRRSRVARCSTRYAGAVARTVSWLLVAGLAAGTFATWPGGSRGGRGVFLGYALPGLQLLLCVAYLANLVWGTTVRAVTRGIEVRLAAWLEKRLLALAGE